MQSTLSTLLIVLFFPFIKDNVSGCLSISVNDKIGIALKPPQIKTLLTILLLIRSWANNKEESNALRSPLTLQDISFILYFFIYIPWDNI